jgi:hypothetical protein
MDEKASNTWAENVNIGRHGVEVMCSLARLLNGFHTSPFSHTLPIVHEYYNSIIETHTRT